MLILRNIRVWDTGEIIDMVIPSADARNQPEDGGVIEGDFDATGLTVAPASPIRTCISAIPARPIRNPWCPAAGRLRRAATRTYSSCRTLSPPWTGVR